MKLTDLSPRVFSTGFSLIHIHLQNREKMSDTDLHFSVLSHVFFRKHPESLLLNKIKKFTEIPSYVLFFVFLFILNTLFCDSLA